MNIPPAIVGVTLAASLLIAEPAHSAGCPADLNGDGVVDIADLLLLLQDLGPCKGCPADIDGDGSVNSPDMAILLGSWGPCPPAVQPGDEEKFIETVAVDVTSAEAAVLGLTVTHLYATGAEVAVGDILLQVDETQISTNDATLYQNVLGNDLPPNSAILEIFPELAFDTFVTMRALTTDNNLVEFVDMDHDSVSDWWFVTPGPTREAVDISAITGNLDQAGVLIAQVTLRCAGDVNLDGTVGTADLLDMLAAWGGGGPADFTNDNTVSTEDLLILLGGWGRCAPGYAGTVRLYTAPENGGTLVGIEVPVQFR